MTPDFQVDGQSPEDWITHEGEELRSLPGRRVFRARAGGVPVVVKEFTPRGLRDRLRSRARVEAAAARRVADRGLPVVEPLALMRLADGRERLFLREVEGARSVQEIFEEGRSPAGERHRLACRLGRLVACIHAARIRHRDLHADNILVRPDGELVLVDASCMRTAAFMSRWRKTRSLARFVVFFLERTNRVQRYLFLREYVAASSLGAEALGTLERRVREGLPAAFHYLTRKRTESARRHAMRFHYNGFRGLAFAPIDPGMLERITALGLRPDPGPDALSAGRTSRNYHVGDPVVGEYMVKVYGASKRRKWLLNCFRGDRPERAVRRAMALQKRGIPSAPVVAIAHGPGFRPRRILVLRWLGSAEPLHHVVRQRPPSESRALVRRAAHTLRRMHDRGCRHRDLKWDNVLIDPDGRLVLLDVDGVYESRFGPARERGRARDLARLEASVSGFCIAPRGLRLRFLQAYVELSDFHRPDGDFRRRILKIAERWPPPAAERRERVFRKHASARKERA